MGDRVAVLKDGVLQQVDTPRNMYDHPANVFVAGFIGSPAMNLLQVDAEGGTLHFGGADVPIPRETAEDAGKARPQGHRRRPARGHGHRRRGAGPQDRRQPGRGARRRRLRLRHRGRRRQAPTTSSPGSTAAQPPEKGETVNFAPKQGHVHLFSTDDRRAPQGLTRGGEQLAGHHVAHGPAAARRTQRPGAARPAVGHPAGGLAGRPAGRAAARHLPARRAVRPARRAVYAVKEIAENAGPARVRPAAPAGAARRCRRSRRSPSSPAGSTTTGEPLDPALVTRHLQFSLPYRALFSTTLRPDTANRLLDALAVLLVRLHLRASSGATARCPTRCSAATPARSRRTSSTPRPASCTATLSDGPARRTTSTSPAPTSPASCSTWRPAACCTRRSTRSRSPTWSSSATTACGTS